MADIWTAKGNSGTASTESYGYTISSNTWAVGNSCVTGDWSATCGVGENDKGYCMGGRQSPGTVGEAFDKTAGTWSLITARAVVQYRHPNVEGIGDNVYTAPFGTSGNGNLHYIYSTTGNSWSVGTVCNYSGGFTSGHRWSSVDDRYHVSSGGYSTPVANSSYYDVSGSSWTASATMLINVNGAGGARYGTGSGITVGGETGDPGGSQTFAEPSGSWVNGPNLAANRGWGACSGGEADINTSYHGPATTTAFQSIDATVGSWVSRAAFTGSCNNNFFGVFGVSSAPIPTTNVIGYWGYVTGSVSPSTVLSLHCDGADASTTFLDSSASEHAVTAAGDAQVDIAAKKYGTGAALFDGTGDYLSTPNHSDFDFYGNFTVECWYRHAAGSSNVMLANCPGTAATVGWALLYSSGSLYFQVSNGAGGWSVQVAKTWTPSVGTWYHIAATRSGTVIRVFVDGVVCVAPGSYGAAITSANALYIGGYTNAASLHNGHLDEIYIVNGAALYTASFTPPTAAHAEQVATWNRFESGAIETGSDYGTIAFAANRAVYWRPELESMQPSGNLRVKLIREN